MAVKEIRGSRTWLLLLLAWAVALISTLGALFIGEIMGQAPCVLCWFQRAFMFPLAIVLGIAALRSDADIWRYALPLSLAGGLIAAYHTLQYFEIIPAPIVQCGVGPSCGGAGMTILGGVPLPLLALGSFAAIALLLLLLRKRVQS